MQQQYEPVTAWMICKGILMAFAIISGTGVILSLMVMSAMSNSINKDVAAQLSKSESSSQGVSPNRQFSQTLRSVSDAFENAALRDTQFGTKALANSPKGRQLARECDDWLDALGNHDVPATRQGAKRACDKYDNYVRRK